MRVIELGQNWWVQIRLSDESCGWIAPLSPSCKMRLEDTQSLPFCQRSPLLTPRSCNEHGSLILTGSNMWPNGSIEKKGFQTHQPIASGHFSFCPMGVHRWLSQLPCGELCISIGQALSRACSRRGSWKPIGWNSVTARRGLRFPALRRFSLLIARGSLIFS